MRNYWYYRYRRRLELLLMLAGILGIISAAFVIGLLVG